MGTTALFLSIVLGLYLSGAYLERKRRVPTLAEVAGDIGAFNRGLEMELAQRAPRSGSLRRMLRRAGLGPRVRLAYVAVAVIALAIIGWQLGERLLPGLLSRAAVMVALGALPLAALKQRGVARDKDVSAQLPQVLTTLIPALLSGTRGVEDCFREFVREQRILGPSGKQQRIIGPGMLAPLGPELFRVYHDVAFGGMSLEDAVGNSIQRVDQQGYEDLLIGILAAKASSTPAKELADLRIAVERERSSKREVASAVSTIMMEAAAVPAIGLVGLIAMRLIVPGSDKLLAQPGAQALVAIAWLLGLGNILRGLRIASLEHILRHIEI